MAKNRNVGKKVASLEEELTGATTVPRIEAKNDAEKIKVLQYALNLAISDAYWRNNKRDEENNRLSNENWKLRKDVDMLKRKIHSLTVFP